MQIKTFIYGLTTTDNDEIRYIGKADNPIKRLNKHITNTRLALKNGDKLTHKDNWIIKNNFKIKCIILEECYYSIWSEREIHHISSYTNLTNTSKGGLGGGSIIYTITYDEVKKIVIALNITSKKAWGDYIKLYSLPDGVSRTPSTTYKNRGWVSWGDFLGTGNKWDNDVNYLTYNEGKEFLSKYNLKTAKDYQTLIKNNDFNLPLKPNRFYKNRGWVSWGDFLGTGKIANQLREFYTYTEFKRKVKELKLNTFTEFKKFIINNKEDKKIPTNPNIVYKNNGWISWSNIIN
jgi:hypothetical protein